MANPIFLYSQAYPNQDFLHHIHHILRSIGIQPHLNLYGVHLYHIVIKLLILRLARISVHLKRRQVTNRFRHWLGTDALGQGCIGGNDPWMQGESIDRIGIDVTCLIDWNTTWMRRRPGGAIKMEDYLIQFIIIFFTCASVFLVWFTPLIA